MASDLHQRIYVFGASGSGTTTLAAELATHLGFVHVDCDDHFWAPVDPPYSVKCSIEERLQSMRPALGVGSWILSGSCHNWAGAILADVTMNVFTTLPTDLRLDRLRRREAAEFGNRIKAGGDLFENHRSFMDWASHYDDPAFDGRNRAGHEAWLAGHRAPVCRIDSRQSVEASVTQVLVCLKGSED